MLTFDIAGSQVDGARDYQEDAFLINRLSNLDGTRTGALVVVADGMGGHAAGNVASNMAVQIFNKHLISNFPGENLAAVLREAVVLSNESIRETVRETTALKGMGSTIVAALMEDTSLYWASVGDSHLYLLRDKALKKLNVDHSYGGYVTRMAAQGKPVAPDTGLSRNMLMSVLTGEEINDIDCPATAITLQAGDRLIIASDGLDTLSQGNLLVFMETCKTAKDAVEAMLRAIQSAGMPRQDNATVVAVLIGEKNAPPAPPPPARPQYTPRGLASPPIQSPSPRISQASAVPKRSKAPLGMLAVAALLIAGYGLWPRSSMIPPSPSSITRAQVPTAAAPAILTAQRAPQATAEVLTTPTTVPVDALPPSATGTGQTFRDVGGPLMVRIPAGHYLMGSPDNGTAFSERPQHAVKLGTFSIGVYEITIAEYNTFAAANGRGKPHTGAARGATNPVFFVNWQDAVAYAAWLSAHTGKRYRLPTEAEWEYAARAGTQSDYWWGRELGEGHAHCVACGSTIDAHAPASVGQFAHNAYGLYDTAGNVQEWVADCYHDTYEGAPSDGSVFSGGDCRYHVVRGGAFSNGPKALRSAAREKFQTSAASDSVGFRIVREN